MAVFPSAVAADSDLYVAVNATSTQLTDNPLTDSATTVNVVSTTGFPSTGFISIDNEIIHYTGITSTSFTGCTRGADGTIAASHVQNSQVFHNVIAAHHNALKEEVKAIEQNLSDRIGLSSTQLLPPVGSAGAPSFSFIGDTDTGIYRGAADTLNFTTNGINRITLDTASLVSTLPILTPNGLVSAIAVGPSAESNTGLYFTTGNLRFAVTGVQQFQLSSAAAFVHAGQLLIQDGTNTVPGFSFIGDLDTGIYRIGPNEIGFAAGSGARFRIFQGVFSPVPGSGSVIRLEDGSATSPALSFTNDTDTGLSDTVANRLDLISGGVRALSVDSSVTAADIRLLVFDVTAGTIVRVSRGDVDSGGTNFRVLRIPN